MEKSESIVEISKALAKFRQQVKQPMKDANNPYFSSKYVPLENVVEAIDDAAPNNGLSYVQWPTTNEDGRVGVATMILHTSGEYMEFEPVYMKPEKMTPQGAGSTISYLKRYSLSAIFGITSDQDDDANEASGNRPQNRQAKPSQNNPLNDEITTKFSEALGVVANKDELYKIIQTNKNAMSKLLGSSDKAKKQEMIRKLEGVVNDKRNAG